MSGPVTIDKDPLLAEAQAARILNMSVRTLQAWRLRGYGPVFVRIGRTIRYRRRDVVHWIEEHLVAGGQSK